MSSKLDHERVPPDLRALIPLAEQFGIADDIERERLVLAAPPDELTRLKEAVDANDDRLDEWLAGPEAEGPVFSDEYIAFSAMRMAADFA